jgi:hypothetical protein
MVRAVSSVFWSELLLTASMVGKTTAALEGNGESRVAVGVLRQLDGPVDDLQAIAQDEIAGAANRLGGDAREGIGLKTVEQIRVEARTC